MARRRKKQKERLNVMESLSVMEISGVDYPMQQPATVTLAKRADVDGASFADNKFLSALVTDLPDEIRKAVRMTSNDDGHSHLIYDDGQDGGMTSYSSGNDEEFSHAHPWMMGADGTITIGETDGHSHTVGGDSSRYVGEKNVAKAGDDGLAYDDEDEDDEDDEDDMATKTTDSDSDRVKKLEAELAAARHLAEMTDAEKAFYRGLEGTDAEAFLAKSASERTKAIDAANREDRVVYKSRKGLVFRASDDPRFVEMAKQADAEAERADNEYRKRIDLEYEKRASAEVATLPGQVGDRAALLKAVDTIEDTEQRDRVLAMLKSHDNGIGAAMERRGTMATGDGDLDDPLTKTAKERAEQKGISIDDAMGELMLERRDNPTAASAVAKSRY